MTEATFVFRHTDEKEARRFCMELMDRYPFAGEGDTGIIAMATGDAMSVSDAVRAALLCDDLDGASERAEFALDMCDRNNWEDCLSLAEEWGLTYHEGQFIDLPASAGRNAERQDRETGLGPKDEHAVGEAETPKGGDA